MTCYAENVAFGGTTLIWIDYPVNNCSQCMRDGACVSPI